MICLDAKLSDFFGRKDDGEPRVKTIWLALQGARDFVKGIAFVSRLD